jgi:hypothetical protein
MNAAQLWKEPKKKSSIPPQAFVAAGLLAVLLLGTSGWQLAGNLLNANSQTFFATNSR